MQPELQLWAYSALLLHTPTETSSEGDEPARDFGFSRVISGHHSTCLQLLSHTATCWVPNKTWWGLAQRIVCLGWSHSPCDKCCVILVPAPRGRENTFFCFVFVLYILLRSWVCETKITALIYWQGSWEVFNRALVLLNVSHWFEFI